MSKTYEALSPNITPAHQVLIGVTVDYLMTGETKADEIPYYINDEARELRCD